MAQSEYAGQPLNYTNSALMQFITSLHTAGEAEYNKQFSSEKRQRSSDSATGDDSAGGRRSSSGASALKPFATVYAEAEKDWKAIQKNQWVLEKHGAVKPVSRMQRFTIALMIELLTHSLTPCLFCFSGRCI